jgi:hypothetical protein
MTEDEVREAGRRRGAALTRDEARALALIFHATRRTLARRLCDYPGCDRPATTFAQAQGAATPTKEWFGCDRHRAEMVPGER